MGGRGEGSEKGTDTNERGARIDRRTRAQKMGR